MSYTVKIGTDKIQDLVIAWFIADMKEKGLNVIVDSLAFCKDGDSIIIQVEYTEKFPSPSIFDSERSESVTGS